MAAGMRHYWPFGSDGEGCPRSLVTSTCRRTPAGRGACARHKEILAYFDTGDSNGPVGGINRRPEHLCGIAQGFRNPEYYILRSLLRSGQLANRINAL